MKIQVNQRTLLALCITLSLLIFSIPTQAEEALYLIDAHSQVSPGMSPDELVSIMDKAGVAHVILSARGGLDVKEIAKFARVYPDRITGAVSSKGKLFNNNSDKFYKKTKMQLRMPEYGAMAEAILYHAKKGNKAPEVTVPLDTPQVQWLMEKSVERGWPFILHIEFKQYRGKTKTIMKHLETMLRAHPDHPFVLIHMGQLEADTVRELIETYPNIYFMTSHGTDKGGKNSLGWTQLLSGSQLKDSWKELFIAHPDRFIFAIDANWVDEWRHDYKGMVSSWRKALMGLPPEVAHKIGHGNAERLWKLNPL
ncbi:amidohydrolase [Pseudodesulfovibrio sp.]|nr:amidohydrolase [Pseudodesulfovibrio sp.]